MKYITNRLDHIFELNFDQTELKCIFSYDETSTTGRFDVTDIEYEKLSAKSRKFRNLTSVLRKHIKLDSHQKKAKVDGSARRRDERPREIGRRIGTFSYFMFKHDLPFTLFTSFMPWFALSKIDLGEVNHSTRFIENFVTPVYDVLLKRLQSLLEKPLPCTGKPTPFAILADKGTIKRDVTQPTLIRTASV